MDIAKSLQRYWGPVLENQVVNIIAYGSGAIPQTKDTHIFNSNTLDLIIEVRNYAAFHEQLMRIRPSDYAGASYLLGSSFLKWTQQTIFPMHSNHVSLEGKKIKYSIVSTLTLRQDLNTWKYLSFAGRLQKPIMPVTPLKEGLEIEISRNRQSAIAIALLMQKIKSGKKLSYQQLFTKVCQISYIGDIRFTLAAQNPKKVQNIVSNNYNLFKQIYLPILKSFSQKIKSCLQIEQSGIYFTLSAESLSFLLDLIPLSVQKRLFEMYIGQKSLVDQVLLAGVQQLSKDIRDIIIGINRYSSFMMAAQNVITGSPINNIQYLLAKLKKKKQMTDHK